MKIKEGFILRKIANSDVVIPVGNNIANFNGIISLNGTAAFLWSYLKEGVEISKLVEVIMKEYQIGKETAQSDIENFTAQLQQANMIEIYE